MFVILVTIIAVLVQKDIPPEQINFKLDGLKTSESKSKRLYYLFRPPKLFNILVCVSFLLMIASMISCTTKSGESFLVGNYTFNGTNLTYYS